MDWSPQRKQGSLDTANPLLALRAPIRTLQMFIGQVTGEITATIQHPDYEHRRLLVVDRLDESGSPTGGYLLAVAATDAGVGDRVLVLDEGTGARQILRSSSAPVRSVVVGVVDQIDIV